MHSLVRKPDRVLEVASGPGWHSMILASSFLQKGGVLVSCDISQAMVTKMEKLFTSEHCEYSLVEGNKFLAEKTDFTAMSDDGKQLKNMCDLNQVIQAQQPFRKLVYTCQANNEMLPFGDESFGGYVANLSLQLVDNYKNQLKEAFRVLKPNSIATFSVWGRRSESLHFSLVDQVLESHIDPEKIKAYYAARSNFNLYDDKGAAVK